MRGSDYQAGIGVSSSVENAPDLSHTARARVQLSLQDAGASEWPWRPPLCGAPTGPHPSGRSSSALRLARLRARIIRLIVLLAF